MSRGIPEADDEGQDDDADDVVNDGGTHNGGADFSTELSQFPEGRNRDADRGGSQYHADEDGPEELIAANGREAVEAGIEEIPADQRDKNAAGG